MVEGRHSLNFLGFEAGRAVPQLVEDDAKRVVPVLWNPTPKPFVLPMPLLDPACSGTLESEIQSGDIDFE